MTIHQTDKLSFPLWSWKNGMNKNLPIDWNMSLFGVNIGVSADCDRTWQRKYVKLNNSTFHIRKHIYKMLELFIVIYLLTGSHTHLQQRCTWFGCLMMKNNPTNKKEVSYAEFTCGAQVVPAYKTDDWITTDSGPVWLSSMCLDDPPTSRQVISQSQSKTKIVWILEGVQRTTCMEMNHHELAEIT